MKIQYNYDESSIIGNISNKYVKNGNTAKYVVGENLEVLDSVFKYKQYFDSKKFQIFEIRNPKTEQQIQLNTWECSKIVAKMFKMPYRGNYAVFPLAHTKK